MEIIATLGLNSSIQRLHEAGATGLQISPSFLAMGPLATFSLTHTLEAIEEAHRLGLKAGVQINAFVMEEQQVEVEHQIQTLLEAQPDWIWFHDPMIFETLKKFNQTSLGIYDATTLTTNAEDIQFWKEQGCASVTLSDTLTQEECLQLASSCPYGEVKAFGYFVTAVSHRRFLTDYQQAIQLTGSLAYQEGLFLQEENREGKMPIYEEEQGTLVYQDTIFWATEEMKQLADKGIKQFRLDGSFLPEEVLLQAVSTLSQVLQGTGSDTLESQYPTLVFSKGYAYQKTNVVKVK